jgi:hypothetical protein
MKLKKLQKSFLFDYINPNKQKYRKDRKAPSTKNLLAT